MVLLRRDLLRTRFQTAARTTQITPPYTASGRLHRTRPAMMLRAPAAAATTGPRFRCRRALQATLPTAIARNSTMSGRTTLSLSTKPSPKEDRTPAYPARQTGQLKLGNSGNTAAGAAITARSQDRSPRRGFTTQAGLCSARPAITSCPRNKTVGCLSSCSGQRFRPPGRGLCTPARP